MNFGNDWKRMDANLPNSVQVWIELKWSEFRLIWFHFLFGVFGFIIRLFTGIYKDKQLRMWCSIYTENFVYDATIFECNEYIYIYIYIKRDWKLNLDTKIIHYNKQYQFNYKLIKLYS